ncbi:MAG TPA: alanyl-tRNA editing protein [Candidatus Bilamarchaeum sp.]|nr:alanyl-tRNA editing protein [Candidatus Bilamarchaeum sp.]
MTELLCLSDSYLKECDSAVVSASGKEVVLDRTVFYPRGGGQPGDTGKIVSAAGEFRVSDTSKKDGLVIHSLETESHGLRAGDKVRCVIDWERRYRLMRMHTAAHVLAATMHRELGILISGNQLEEDKSRFDFTMQEFDRAKFEMAVGKANEELSRDLELKVYSLPRQDALKLPGVVKLAGALPPSISVLRIVEIPGIDLQADGGTHVRNLSEVGKIGILRLDNKGKDNRRIYFNLSK